MLTAGRKFHYSREVLVLHVFPCLKHIESHLSRSPFQYLLLKGNGKCQSTQECHAKNDINATTLLHACCGLTNLNQQVRSPWAARSMSVASLHPPVATRPYDPGLPPVWIWRSYPYTCDTPHHTFARSEQCATRGYN